MSQTGSKNMPVFISRIAMDQMGPEAFSKTLETRWGVAEFINLYEDEVYSTSSEY